MNEIIFQVNFSDHYHKVEIATENTKYTHLNRTFFVSKSGFGDEYTYLQAISWMLEIPKILRGSGDYATFVRGSED